MAQQKSLHVQTIGTKASIRLKFMQYASILYSNYNKNAQRLVDCTDGWTSLKYLLKSAEFSVKCA